MVSASDARLGQHIGQCRNAFHDGNLSYQIEHHLFPDLPSNRYQEIAPKVQEVFERYGLTTPPGHCPGRSPGVGQDHPAVAAQRLPREGVEPVTALTRTKPVGNGSAAAA